MSQEPETKNKNDVVAQKLLIDRPSDFRFHAAYLAYSESWDKSTSQEVRSKLNEIIESLAKNEIDYQNFYERISQYRTLISPELARSRMYIETQRKKDWRKREARNAREARHKR